MRRPKGESERIDELGYLDSAAATTWNLSWTRALFLGDRTDQRGWIFTFNQGWEKGDCSHLREFNPQLVHMGGGNPFLSYDDFGSRFDRLLKRFEKDVLKGKFGDQNTTRLFLNWIESQLPKEVEKESWLSLQYAWMKIAGAHMFRIIACIEEFGITLREITTVRIVGALYSTRTRKKSRFQVKAAYRGVWVSNWHWNKLQRISCNGYINFQFAQFAKAAYLHLGAHHMTTHTIVCAKDAGISSLKEKRCFDLPYKGRKRLERGDIVIIQDTLPKMRGTVLDRLGNVYLICVAWNGELILTRRGNLHLDYASTEYSKRNRNSATLPSAVRLADSLEPPSEGFTA